MGPAESRAQRTKMNILRAAEEIFAAKGLDGARVDEIAAAAGANKRMLYAYYGSKEQLYQTVLETVYHRLGACEEQLPEEEDVCAAIGTLVQAYFSFLARDPNYVRMVMWENLYEARHFDAAGLSDIRDPMRRTMRRLLQKGKAQGVFRQDAQEEQVLSTLFACTFNYFSNIHTMSRVMKTDLHSGEALQARAKNVTETLLCYLTYPQKRSTAP